MHTTCWRMELSRVSTSCHSSKSFPRFFYVLQLSPNHVNACWCSWSCTWWRSISSAKPSDWFVHANRYLFHIHVCVCVCVRVCAWVSWGWGWGLGEMELRVGSHIMIHFLYILLFLIWHMYLYIIHWVVVIVVCIMFVKLRKCWRMLVEKRSEFGYTRE